MGRFSSDLRRFVKGAAVSVLASGAKTATGNSGWLNAEDIQALSLTLDCTARSGTTPTLDVSVETAEDSSGTRSRTVGSFTQVTATGTQRKSFGPLDRYYRVVWTIGGTTPSFTISIAGDGK
jgi:hypothetical protein